MTEHRVFGPPGTGKTTYLARQVNLAAQRYGPDGVVCASFTRAAAAELASRDLPLDRDHVGTLHALCYRAFSGQTIAETRIKEFNSSQDLYALSGEGIDLDEPEQHFDTEADRIFARYQVERAQMTPYEQWPLEVVSFAKQWEGWKSDSGYIDFTDMIEVALQEGVPPPDGSVVGFFDEVQDFTALELALVRQWGASLDTIVLAGDDDQCIYGFKGATPDAFLNPPVPDENKRILDHSWRLPVLVHTWASLWISEVQEREWKWFSPRDEEGAVRSMPEYLYRVPDALVEEAAERAELGKTVMLLASCSFQVGMLVAALKTRGLLFHNPYRRKRGDWNPLRASGRNRTGAQRLLSLLRFDQRVYGDEAGDWTYGDLADWMPLVRKTGVFRRGSWQRIAEGQPADRPVSYATLDALLEDGVLDAIYNDPLGWVDEHAAADRKKGLAYPLVIARKRGAAALLDPNPRIIVGTIHSVKGGEADEVYLLPDLSPAGFREWDSDATRPNVIRQFYVGATRARERLTLCGRSSPAAVRWLEGW